MRTKTAKLGGIGILIVVMSCVVAAHVSEIVRVKRHIARSLSQAGVTEVAYAGARLSGVSVKRVSDDSLASYGLFLWWDPQFISRSTGLPVNQGDIRTCEDTRYICCTFGTGKTLFTRQEGY